MSLNAAIFERTQILVQDDGIRRLRSANVFLAGCGGVGGHCAEALVRSGIGRLTICDHDVVSSTNKNRQLIALDSTIGNSKVMELGRRLRDISALCEVTTLDAFLLPEDMEEILQRQAYTHVADCIDSVECKVALLAAAVKLGLEVVSSCGAGGRLDPSKVGLRDLFNTENDGLARACRNELRKLGVGPGAITAVHSSELPRPPLEPQRQESGGRDRAINGTMSYMPPLFGLVLAAAVIRSVVEPDVWASDVKTRKKESLKGEEVKMHRAQQPPSNSHHKRHRDAGAGVAEEADETEAPESKQRRSE